MPPDNLSKAFGLLIAFLAPGLIGLFAVSFFSSVVRDWLGVAAQQPHPEPMPKPVPPPQPQPPREPPLPDLISNDFRLLWFKRVGRFHQSMSSSNHCNVFQDESCS